MDWMSWVLLAATVLSVGAVIYLRMKGYLTTDATTLCIATMMKLVRKEEDLWKDYQGAGSQKKPGSWRSCRRWATSTTKPQPVR